MGEDEPKNEAPENLEGFESTNLRELLTYDNPHRAEYDALIGEVAATQQHFTDDNEAVKANASLRWHRALELEKDENAERLIQYLKDKIGGDILLDLGGSWGSMEGIAELIEARTYISVDKYLDSKKPIDPYVNISHSEEQQSGKPEKILIQADILDFVSRLPDNSVNVTINGIDSILLPVAEYHKALAKELVRVAKKGGVIFGVGSDSLEYAEKNPEVEEKDFRDVLRLAPILEKKS